MKRFLAIVISIYLLSVSVGLALSKHTCYLFNITEYSLQNDHQCCNDESESDLSLSSKCCNLEQLYFKADLSDATSITVSALDFTHYVQPGETYVFQGVLLNFGKTLPFSDSSPPLISGKERIILHQSFLI